MKRLRSIRAFAAAAVLAAAGAALPSLDWCPMEAWVAAACEIACETAPTRAGEAPRARPCDPQPDPIPFGDRVWCIRPPVTALLARADGLPEPQSSTPVVDLVERVVLTPPTASARARSGPGPGPPVLRVPHGPSQARAPPIA